MNKIYMKNRISNVFTFFHQHIAEALYKLYPNIDNIDNIAVELPRDVLHGDIATNVAMVMAKKLGISPMELAKEIAAELQKNSAIESIDIVKPGFINFKLQIDFWHSILNEIWNLGMNYGHLSIGTGLKINIEFVSANPTGPIHIGHARSAIYGDALANLLKKCGFEVVKEYYINDAGRQIDILVNSLFIRYQQIHKIDIILPDNCYPGEYLITAAKELKKHYGDKLLHMDSETRFTIIKKFAVDYMMSLIKADLAELGVVHDVFISEQNDIINKGKIEQTVSLLESYGLIYKGILEAPKSKVSDDWEASEQTIFKSTAFGDDLDRPVIRSDGSYTYFAPDIAYHLYKIERGFNRMVLLLGADHGGYVKRMQAAVEALSHGKARIDIKINQLVNLLKDGKPFKMSKRSGNFVTLKDMLNEVDKDILKFVMLAKKNDTVIDLDCDKVKEQSKENPVFYVQYAHTRAYSIISKATKMGIVVNNKTRINYSKLNTTNDILLIKQIALFPKMLESAAIYYEPHRISYYLYDLANLFHQSWAKGVEDENLRFIIAEDLELTQARLILVHTIANTIAIGLNIMGVEPIKEM